MRSTHGHDATHRRWQGETGTPPIPTHPLTTVVVPTTVADAVIELHLPPESVEPH